MLHTPNESRGPTGASTPALDRSGNRNPSAASRDVLIVDHSRENRDVLRTVLQRRGCRILEANGPAEGLQLVRRYRPAVVVLDADADSEDAVRSACRPADGQPAVELVVLGDPRHRLGDDRFVAKPYHYGPLIHTIEALLAGR